MKKKLLIAVLAAAMLSQSITAFAAPKKMADGVLFDAEYYASTYPDVRAAFGNNANMLYMHYNLIGKNEGRKPYAVVTAPSSTSASSSSDFDAAYYAATYPDVVAALGSNPDTLYMHWTMMGKAEGRRGKAPVVVTKTEEKSNVDVESIVDDLIEDNEEIVRRLVIKINDYRGDNDRKDLKLNSDLVRAAQTIAYYNDLNDKSSKKANGHSYNYYIDDDYDYSDCINFECDDDTAKEVFAELMEEADDDEFKEKVYRNIGIGNHHEYWIVIMTD